MVFKFFSVCFNTSFLISHCCTLGGGYTQVHQDGHGTVDSGHSNLSGFNEVVMLRRLPECHKLQACMSIPTLSGVRIAQDAINTLYKLPHDDGRVSSIIF